MIEVAGEKIWFFDTHCQWYQHSEAELFLAALSYLGYDGGIMAIPETTPLLRQIVAESGIHLSLLPGKEHLLDYAHLISLGFEGEAPQSGSHREKLEYLKEHSRLLLYAHPFCHKNTRANFLDTGEAVEMFKAGLLDGFELFNGWEYEGDCRENFEFFEHYGFPIVAGCDTHLSRTAKRPAIVYNAEYPAFRDIDALGGVKTLILAEDPTMDAVADAVKTGRSLVEAGGKLYGQKKLVAKLENNRYSQIAQLELESRRKLTLQCDRLLAGGETLFKTSPEAVKWYFCGQNGAVIDGKFQLRLPKNPPRERSAVCVENREGIALCSAIKILPRFELLLSGEFVGETPTLLVTVKNNTAKTVDGVIEFAEKKVPCRITPDGVFLAKFPVKFSDPAYAQNYRVKFYCNGEIVEAEEDFAFVAVPRHGSSAEIRLDRADQLFDGRWEGREDCSGVLHLAQSPEGLQIHARITDPVHDQRHHGEWLFFGDALQFGISFSDRASGKFSFYNFLAGLTDSGAELCLASAPAMSGLHAPVLLPSEFIAIVPDEQGLDYKLTIPWSSLNPFHPESGAVFRLFIRLFDSKGVHSQYVCGVKSVLEWPNRSEAWMSGSNWGNVLLL